MGKPAISLPAFSISFSSDNRQFFLCLLSLFDFEGIIVQQSLFVFEIHRAK
jgi:hypothetical protein